MVFVVIVIVIAIVIIVVVVVVFFVLVVVVVRVRLPYGLSPSVSLLDRCVRLVSLLSPFVPSCWSLCPPFRPSVSFCLPSCLSSCWSMCPPCHPSVSLCLRFPSCWSLCPPCLPSASLFSFLPLSVSFLFVTVSFCLPPCLPSFWSYKRRQKGEKTETDRRETRRTH